MTTSSHPSVGTPAEKYELLKELGRGGMGVVHLAVSRGPQGFRKLVVLKMMRKALLGDFESHRMFLEEGRISAHLSHPNVVQVFEVTEHDGMPTIVMEYLKGQPLSAVLFTLDGHEPMPLALRLHVLTKVLAGLGAAHEMRDYAGSPLNLVHRDASPHNVFVLYDGQVKVLDFGIAKTAGSDVETQAGVLKGKVRYMPPEQLLHIGQDQRADIFTVGVVLWELLADRRMWADRTDEQVIKDVIMNRLPPLPADANVPAELAAICQRALAGEPQSRYQTAVAFQQELDSYLERLPSRVGPAEVADYMRGRYRYEDESARSLVESHIRLERQKQQAPAVDSTRVGLPEQLVVAAAAAAAAPPKRRMRWPAFVAWPAMIVLAALTLLLGLFEGGKRLSRGRHADEPSAAGARVAENCGVGLKACGTACVSTERPDRGCGNDSCDGCGVANATARCNQLRRCDIAVCYRGFDDCDGSPDNGCETNVRTDPDNCGGCGRKCRGIVNGRRGCGDSCTIWRCDPGFRDCNRLVDDGCEVAVMSDPTNCGRCGHACAAGQRCRKAVCG